MQNSEKFQTTIRENLGKVQRKNKVKYTENLGKIKKKLEKIGVICN